MTHKPKLTGSDLFCGGGGWTEGVKIASQRLGFDLARMICVNHWTAAMNTHKRNHPYAQHVQNDLNDIDPAAFGKLDFLIASPECTHFSNALGAKPINDQKRTPARNVITWIRDNQPEFFGIENVREFLDWGPLDSARRPIRERKGEYFHKYVVAPIRALGYSLDWRVLCCADYGDPTSRRRLFICGRRDGQPVLWPEPTHSARPDQTGLAPWVPARDIIDWSIPGTSIFTRARPLCPNTMRRIETGIRKFWGEWAEPFLVILKGQSTAVSIDAPLPALCAGKHLALVQPLLTKLYGTSTTADLNNPLPTITAGGNKFGLVQAFLTQNEHGGRIHSVYSPLPTITGNSRAFDLVQPFLLPQQQGYDGNNVRSIYQPLPTLTAAGSEALLRPFLLQYNGNTVEAKSIDRPLPTITTKDRFGLVQQFGVDICYRMLLPHELAAGMGFPRDYYWYGSKTKVVRQIGNAVPVNTAAALVSCLIVQTGLMAKAA